MMDNAQRKRKYMYHALIDRVRTEQPEAIEHLDDLTLRRGVTNLVKVIEAALRREVPDDGTASRSDA